MALTVASETLRVGAQVLFGALVAAVVSILVALLARIKII